MTADNWFHEETDDPLHADRRNFYKVEKWSRMGSALRNCCSLGTASTKLGASLIGSPHPG
jgi:hypothetical protein